ncbi:MAG: response regulator transcription factor [Pseudomonadota bacterium]
MAHEARIILRWTPEVARANCPGVIVLDMGLPDANGLDAIGPLLDAVPEARILVFSMNDRLGFAGRALDLGAHGFLSKNAPAARFSAAIQTVMRGEIHLEHDVAIQLVSRSQAQGGDPLEGLTDREREVLFGLGDGLELAAIAERLNVSYKTTANASSALKRKLRAKCANGLIRIAIENRPSQVQRPQPA